MAKYFIMSINQRILPTLFLLLLFSSFIELNITKLDFATEEKLIHTVNYFHDSTVLSKEIGKNYKSEHKTTHYRMIDGGSIMKKTTSYQYIDLGVDFIYTYSINGRMNDDLSKVEKVKENKTLTIILDSISKIPVYGLRTNKSHFEDLFKLKINGVWVQFEEDETTYFSYITKYVYFNSKPVSENQFDSLNLDCDSMEQMNHYFSHHFITSIDIHDNASLYNRLIK